MKKLSPFDRFVFGFGVALSAGFFALVVLLVSGAMPPDRVDMWLARLIVFAVVAYIPVFLYGICRCYYPSRKENEK